MTRYVAVSEAGEVVVGHLYNLGPRDKIVGEVDESGRYVLPRNPAVEPMKYWWPEGMFAGPRQAIGEFVNKLSLKGETK